jgi:hypothetical protein
MVVTEDVTGSGKSSAKIRGARAYFPFAGRLRAADRDATAG